MSTTNYRRQSKHSPSLRRASTSDSSPSSSDKDESLKFLCARMHKEVVDMDSATTSNHHSLCGPERLLELLQVLSQQVHSKGTIHHDYKKNSNDDHQQCLEHTERVLSKAMMALRRHKRNSNNNSSSNNNSNTVSQKDSRAGCCGWTQALALANQVKRDLKQQMQRQKMLHQQEQRQRQRQPQPTQTNVSPQQTSTNSVGHRRRSGSGQARKPGKAESQQGQSTPPTAAGRATTKEATGTCLPTCASEYRTRLVQEQKELYKDPPVLPPLAVLVYSVQCPTTEPPQRNPQTGQLTFDVGATPPQQERNHELLSQLLTEFHPNKTPSEILRGGAFGGTYFRPIHSAVTNRWYHNSREVLASTVRDDWIRGLDLARMLTSSQYRAEVNQFGVSCGGSLGMWESSGWISDVDPYGWFQWYCRFYQGRRCSDDARQVSRWLKIAGPKGRFRSQLCNKILLASQASSSSLSSSHCPRRLLRHDDASISPVIRQTLWHWGLEITPDILEQHERRTGRK